MRLEDREEFEDENLGTKKIKKIIIIIIILLLILCAAISVLIAYKIYNPTEIKTYIDGKIIQDFDKILDFNTDENGKTQIYVPIRDFATYLNASNKDLGYTTYKGDYEPKTEDDDKCYILRDKYEVAIFSKDTKIIYKKNLQNNTEDYEECYIDKSVFKSNDKLYTSVDGIEKGYNVYFSYDEKKKIINIYTMDYLISSCELNLEKKKIGEYGTMKLDDKDYSNWKTVFDDLLIVQGSNNKYGIMRTGDYSFVLEPQYDDIDFINNSKTFLVKSDNKVGLFSEDGKRKIDLIYDEITLMGRDSNLYMVKSNNQYGVVDENGNIILYPEYEKIGIDVSKFAYNGVKNGYILLDELIPVCKNRKWAFYNKKGKSVTNGFKYDTIGCSSVKTENNVYGLLLIEEEKVIVVGNDNKKYSLMKINGNDTDVPFAFDSIYIKISSGKPYYCMENNGNEIDVLEFLKQK